MRINNITTGVTGRYAEEELSRFLHGIGGCDLNFVLEADPALPPYAYGFDGAGDDVRLIGHGENEVLLAVYHALEAAGFVFSTALIRKPASPDWDALRTRSIVEPFVRLRGIRQHINFPMDISSYSIDEAQEYIRSLARMGMNAITFHSYDGMWHRGPGHFFYNEPHPLPEREDIRNADRNERTHIIPECEPFADDEEKRGQFAVRWLNDVMRTAKSCGMHVTLSIEPAEDIGVAEEALDLYPLIDTLEFITPECGWELEGGVSDAAEIKACAVRLFGERVLDADGTLPGLDESKPVHTTCTWPTLNALYRAVKQVPKLSERIPVRLGLYVTAPETLVIVKSVMDRVLPADMTYTFLPAHGTDQVRKNLEIMGLKREDLQRTVIHSWTEFDGNMYLLQNTANAVSRLMLWLKEFSGAPSVHAVYFNHWRTAENTVALAASAAMCVYPRPVEAWYAEIAKRLGLPAVPFGNWMKRLGELDVFNRDNLFNIGFCARNCWVNPGLSWIESYTHENIAHALGEYTALADEAERLIAEAASPDLTSLFNLLRNRCLCSVEQLLLVDNLIELKADMDPVEARMLLDNAAAHGDRYIQTHLRQMPDRGCEGTIVSYQHVMFDYIQTLDDICVKKLTPAAQTDPQPLEAPAVIK